MADDPTQQQPTGNPPGQGTQDPAGTPPAAPPATEAKTVSAEEHQKELDRYRNQVGQEKRRADELAARIAKLAEAGKTEAERLAERAAKADALEPRISRYEAEIKAEVEARLAKLPKEMHDLMTAEDPAEQLAWIRKAEAAAAKITPQSSLPPSGGRNPAGGADQVNDKLAIDKAQSQFHALKGRRIIGA